MCDVLFVVPSMKAIVREESTGTLLLATILKENKINTDIYRFHQADLTLPFEDFISDTVENILKINPKIVSFYCRCDCFLADIILAKKLKEANSNLKIVFGGPQADASSKEVITLLPFVDYCCSGEGETTIFPLMDAILKGEDVSHVRGLTYKDSSGNIKTTPRAELIKNLDELTDIDYSLVPESIMSAENNPHILMDVGRGCPFGCAYCSSSFFWQRTFRLKSPKKIVSEIEELHHKYGYKRFVFSHDLFTANKKKVLEFCKEIKERNLHITWVCSSRVDTLDEETIKAMADSGLTSVFLGLETGSARIQKLIHKNILREDVINIVSLLMKYNVKVTASFMYGFPEETEEDLEDTLRLVYDIHKLGVRTYQFHLLTILPCTEYYETYKNQLTFAATQSNIVGNFGVEENRDFIEKHLPLFPFYFEYSSDLRDKFKHLSNHILTIFDIYRQMTILDKERFSEMSFIKLYGDFIEANKEFLSENSSDKEVSKYELGFNYLSTVYSHSDVEKLREIFKFHKDSSAFRQDSKLTNDVRNYSVDIGAVSGKKSLNEIKERATIVFFRKQKEGATFSLTYLDNIK